MSNTRSLTIKCTSIQAKADTVYVIELTVDEPNINDLLKQLEEDDIVKYVVRNLSPGEVFPDDTLEEWAEKHGFTKIDQD